MRSHHANLDESFDFVTDASHTPFWTCVESSNLGSQQSLLSLGLKQPVDGRLGRRHG